MSETQSDYNNLDYDEYEQMEAEAEQLASNPNAMIPPAPGARNTAARQQVPAQQRQQKQVPAKSDEEELAELEAQNAAEDEANKLEKAETMPKWVPFHQPEKIGIINTETREIMEGFKDEGTATGVARLMNMVDSIIVGGGYQ